MITALEIAKRLDKNFRQSVSGYMCRCPAHDDDKASLAISDGGNGKPIFHCFAGCDFREIAAELRRRGIEHQAGNDNARDVPLKGRRHKLVATYPYHDADTGELLMEVLRYDDKQFHQRRPDCSGASQWIWGISDSCRTLYRAPEVKKHVGAIFFVEGEKDVESLFARGLVATCMPGGANAKWLPKYEAVLKGKDVVVLPDNDPPGEKYAEAVATALSGVASSVKVLRLPNLPAKGDVTDWFEAGGTAEALLEASKSADLWATPVEDGCSLERFLQVESSVASFETGSEVEIACVLHSMLTRHLGHVVYSEGEFWHYSKTQWVVVDQTELWRGVQHFDGADVVGGRGSKLKLGTRKIGSILHELQMLAASPAFFEAPEQGINCASGFIRFGQYGPQLEPHAPEHRSRHTLPGHWKAGSKAEVPEGSLLHRLLTGCFEGDEDAKHKIDLLGEIAGVAALGYATSIREPKAVVLYGMTAENGKSQILDLIRGLLPPSAVSAITAAKMGDEKHVVGLAGKLLNATDELSGEAIASDTFKTIITGEQVNGRDVYKSRVEFRPRAQHLFATNILPPYKGGMDRGVQRRLLVIPFNRTVPKAERVEHIGRRIGEEEADVLLAWAVAGAARVVRNKAFTEPVSCKRALREWVCKADAVQAWIEDCVEGMPGHWIATKVAYLEFCNWAVAEGYIRERLPNVSVFSDRLRATVTGVTLKRSAHARGLAGFRIKSLTLKDNDALTH